MLNLIILFHIYYQLSLFKVKLIIILHKLLLLLNIKMNPDC